MSRIEEIRKEKFAWASIAGASAEPVELIEVDGRKAILTCGCPDPFYLDDATVNVVVYDAPAFALKRPSNPRTQAEQDRLDQEYRNRPVRHGWRGSR